MREETAKEELPEQWKKSVILPVYVKDNETVAIIEPCHCYLLQTEFCPTFIS
jgi:hypothetical protein